jgi:hypothetical protein
MADPVPPEVHPAPAARCEEPILIGPIGAGKSTLGRLLAQRLGRPQVALDAVRFAYYAEIGYDPALADRLGREAGLLALYRYWRPFEVHAVERAVAEHRDCVFDFGAGHSVYEDPALLGRAQRALAPFAHVVLLLPAPDPAESVRVLRERRGHRPVVSGGVDFDELFVTHPSNCTLATHTIYTAGRTPEEACDELVRLVRREPSRIGRER